MCGIFGSFSPKRLLVQHVEKMAKSLAHRGPDGYAIYQDDYLAFGAGRLSIIDLSALPGPIFNLEKRIGVAFNGEIYNYRHLRAQLLAKGYHFQTKTDTEVLVHAYADKGLAFLQDIEGMFAFCLYDVEARSILLVRDRLGEKPLYYCQIADTIIFASEIKALLVDERIVPQVNHDALPFYLSLGYTPPPMTLFAGIRKLAPGEYLIINESGTQQRFYWQPPHQPAVTPLSYTESVKCVRQNLEYHVESRMVSDVPVGVFLSGGIDSTSIVALMKRQVPKDLHSFTVGFDFAPGSPGDRKFNVDMRYASAAAQAIGTHHHRIMIQEGLLEALLPYFVYQMDEPVAQHSIIQTAFVAALARQTGIPVLLSGDAGDELFLGYRHYQHDRQLERILKLPAVLRRHIVSPVLQRSSRFRHLVPKIQSKDATRRYLEWMRFFRLEESAALLGNQPEHLQAILAAKLNPILDTYQGREFAERIAYTSLKLWVAEDSNMRTDKMSMMMSVETRAPMEGHRFVEMAMGIPLVYKLHAHDSKRIYKDAVRDLLPVEILERSKWGFIPPTSDWLRTVFRPLVNRYLSEDYIRSAGMVDAAWVRPLVEAHMNRTGYFLHEIWALLVLHLWHALYISGDCPLEGRVLAADIVHQSRVESSAFA